VSKIVVVYSVKKGILGRQEIVCKTIEVRDHYELQDKLQKIREEPNFSHIIATGLMLPIDKEGFFEFEKIYFDKHRSTLEDMKYYQEVSENQADKISRLDTKVRAFESAMEKIRWILYALIPNYDATEIDKYGDVEIRLRGGLSIVPTREWFFIKIPTENPLYRDILIKEIRGKYPQVSVKDGTVRVGVSRGSFTAEKIKDIYEAIKSADQKYEKIIA